MLRYYTALILLLLPVVSASAQNPYGLQQETKVSLEEKARRGDKLKGYLIRPDVGIPEQVNLLDTVARGSHNYVSPERRSLGVAYAGNANHPWQSKIFFDRTYRPHDFVYLMGYQKMMYTPDNVLFYNTKTPLTYIHYRKNFGDDVLEEVLNGTIAFNLGKQINLGVSVDHVAAEGYYANNKSRNLDYRVFGSYNTDRYDLWAYIANDYYKQEENGGIKDLSYISNPDQYSSGRANLESLDIPVNIEEPLYNRIRNGQGYLSHRYKLGYRVDSTQFVSVGAISHQFHYNKSSRRFLLNSATLPIFLGTPLTSATTITSSGGSSVTTDVADMAVLKNTLALSLLEGFRPWVKAGLSVYARTENYWYTNPLSLTDPQPSKENAFSTFVGGELARTNSEGFNFHLKGELGVVGRDLGAFLAEGYVKTNFKALGQAFGLKVDGRLANYRPAYYAMHHHGTWGWWDEDLSFTRRLEFGARADLSTLGTWGELRTASLQNQIYWTGGIASPSIQQHSPLIQVTMLRVGHKYQWGALGWEVEGAYQLTTEQNVIPLPRLTCRGDLYFDFMIAKVLQVQIGAEGYWHSAYYAPYYHPTTMQFVNQSLEKVGGSKPLINVYANFRMRTTRFYARFFNAGELLFDSNRQTMYRYVYNPQHIEVGVVLDLKN